MAHVNFRRLLVKGCRTHINTALCESLFLFRRSDIDPLTNNALSRTSAPSMSMVYNFFLQTYLKPIRLLNSGLHPTRSRAKSQELYSKDYIPLVTILLPINK